MFFRCRYFSFCLILLCWSAIAAEIPQEKYNSGWRLNADNDLLAGQRTDRDYTGSLALTLSGRRAQEYFLSIDSWRAGIDNLFDFSSLYRKPVHSRYHSQQYGMTLFTPDDIDTSAPVFDDRPYASLFFMSNSEFTVVPEKDTAYVSRLTVGFLGLDMAENVQGALHAITGSRVPNGWDNQVSAGGEPTAMLSYAVQNNIYGTKSQQLKTEYEANAGFITDINMGFSWRWGRIHSPWWAFNPYQSKYIQQSMPVFASDQVGGDLAQKKNELYLWAGARLNLRLYNAFLQGQFRRSEVTISSGDLQRLVAEYWFGATAELAKKYHASIFLRGTTDEFRGQKSRSLAWVGLVFSRAY